MDLTAEQSRQITALVQTEWFGHSKFELETTFGPKGVVDAHVFLQIAQRLRSKGFEAMPQDDYLNIIVPNDLRFTIENMGIIQSYCRNDTLENVPFLVLRKDKIAGNGTVDLPEYDIRFKIRREEELSSGDPRVVEALAQWKTIRKAFRLIRRWSFKGKGVRIDLSMVRQSPYVPGKAALQWSQTFLEKNILAEIPRYEVEVELLHGVENVTDEPARALKALIAAVGEVQRAIQKNSLILRKSVAQAALTEYMALVKGQKFRGVNPVTLELKNMVSKPMPGTVNIRDGFNVTDKADGLRTMGFVNQTGELYLLDQSLNVYRTGLRCPECASSLVDGEWVTTMIDGKPSNDFLLFDIYHASREQIEDGIRSGSGNGSRSAASDLPFITFTAEGLIDTETMQSRYNVLKDWYKRWSTGEEIVAKGVTPASKLTIVLKHFEFANAGDDTIFRSAAARVLGMPRKYHTDGLILTSNSQPLPTKMGGRFNYQFKWKPAKDNTVDFLVMFEKDPAFPTKDKVNIVIDPNDGRSIRYKTMRLYVGGKATELHKNPRAMILSGQPITKEEDEKDDEKDAYEPILFHPLDFYDTLANTCYVEVDADGGLVENDEDYAMTEDSQEPISHRSIVEMRYDPTREPGWRWIPARIRHDKTERLLRAIAVAKGGVVIYSSMMNDTSVANSVWNSIHDPITESMIRSGSETPLPDEIKVSAQKYYDRKGSAADTQLVRGLQIFHNKHIKDNLLLRNALRYSVGGGQGKPKTVLDLACGKAGDLQKWTHNRARMVVGIDVSLDNITNRFDGAYRRYMDKLTEAMEEKGVSSIPRMAFVIGNSSKSIVDGSAGATPEERDILRSIFGRVAPEGHVPPYISKVLANQYRDGVDVAACMFALHYFFESTDTVQGLLKNLSETVKQGGYFIGCCFDGDRVFDLLRDLPKGRANVGMEGDTIIWSITKEYEQPVLTTDDTSIGLPIDVNFITIGASHREYLVPFGYLKDKLAEIGFRLLTSHEQRELGMTASTGLFDKVYDQVARAGDKLSMPDSVKQFSFLNRWFIFKRQGAEESATAAAVEDVSAAASVELPPPSRPFKEEVTRSNGAYKLYNTVESSNYSVLKPWHKPQVASALHAWLPTADAVKFIVDGTAHIGMDSIHLSTLFPQARVDAYELVPEIYEKLVYNIRAAQRVGQIHPHRDDFSTWSPPDDHRVDLLYVDPPWNEASTTEAIQVYLQSPNESPDPEKSLNRLVDRWIQSQKVNHVVAKVPPNFDMSYLEATYPLQKRAIYGRLSVKDGRPVKHVAFHLLHIKSPYAPAAIELDVATREEEKGDEKESGVSLASAASASKPPMKQTQIFRFGIGAKIARDILGVKAPDAEGKLVPDMFISQWLALYAPSAIPDPDLKTKDGTPVLYPSVEHYMAAMKLRFASNKTRDDADFLATQAFSTKSDLHSTYTMKRKALPKSTAPYGESDAFYDLCIEEAMKARQLVTKKGGMASARVTFDDAQWNGIKDKMLMDALQYRWENDSRFHQAVEATRSLEDGRGRYMLYTTGTTANSVSSEYGGKLSTASHQIEGENKVGVFIMRLAKFTYWV